MKRLHTVHSLSVFLALSGLACGSPETFEQLESTTGCSRDTSPDEQLEGKWELDEIVCLDDSLEEIVTIVNYYSSSASIEARGSCFVSVLDDGYCGPVIGGSFSVPEDSVLTVSNAEVIEITDGSDYCWVYDFVEGVGGYSENELENIWLEVEYNLGQSIPEYSTLYVKSDDGTNVLLENTYFVPSAGGYCFSSYTKDGAADGARIKTANQHEMLRIMKGRVALRKILQEVSSPSRRPTTRRRPPFAPAPT